MKTIAAIRRTGTKTPKTTALVILKKRLKKQAIFTIIIIMDVYEYHFTCNTN